MDDDAPVEIAEIHVSPVAITGTVSLDKRVSVTEDPADFGTYRSVSFAATDPRLQVLPQDNNRVRAFLLVTGTGPLYIGSEAQCAAVSAGNLAGGGFPVPAGILIPIQHRETVWAVPDGTHTATLNIIQERNR